MDREGRCGPCCPRCLRLPSSASWARQQPRAPPRPWPPPRPARARPSSRTRCRPRPRACASSRRQEVCRRGRGRGACVSCPRGRRAARARAGAGASRRAGWLGGGRRRRPACAARLRAPLRRRRPRPAGRGRCCLHCRRSRTSCPGGGCGGAGAVSRFAARGLRWGLEGGGRKLTEAWLLVLPGLSLAGKVSLLMVGEEVGGQTTGSMGRVKCRQGTRSQRPGSREYHLRVRYGLGDAKMASFPSNHSCYSDFIYFQP